MLNITNNGDIKTKTAMWQTIMEHALMGMRNGHCFQT